MTADEKHLRSIVAMHGDAIRLADSFVNGNRKEVMNAVISSTPHLGVHIFIALCEEPSEAEIFLRRLDILYEREAS